MSTSKSKYLINEIFELLLVCKKKLKKLGKFVISCLPINTEDARVVTVIAVINRQGNPNANHERGCMHFA